MLPHLFLHDLVKQIEKQRKREACADCLSLPDAQQKHGRQRVRRRVARKVKHGEHDSEEKCLLPVSAKQHLPDQQIQGIADQNQEKRQIRMRQRRRRHISLFGMHCDKHRPRRGQIFAYLPGIPVHVVRRDRILSVHGVMYDRRYFLRHKA